MAESSFITNPRTSPGSSPGSENIDSSTSSRADCSSRKPTSPTTENLNAAFRNSTCERALNSRRQPAMIDNRDGSGWIRSNARFGGFCSIEDPIPATARMAMTGTSSFAQSSPIAWKSWTTSAPLSSDQPPGSSMKLSSVSRMWITLLERNRPVMMRMPTNEAKLAASREKGTLPFSMASRIFFSVASSVLLSLS